MSTQQAKLEKVLELLVNEDTTLATELLHDIIVEKARKIYESIVDEEDTDEDDIDADDESDADEGDDFTDDISADADDIETDELNDGEADDFADDEPDSADERVDDLEDQLAQLRAEFDALLSDEVKEPNHADLADTVDDIDDEFSDSDDEYGSDDADEFLANSVFEETQFLKAVADTGQKSANPGFIGTGKNTPKGAEQSKVPFSSPTAKMASAGKPVTSKGTGGEYGVYTADKGAKLSTIDNTDTSGKAVAAPANIDKWLGTGKGTGSFGTQQKKAPLSSAPKKST